MSVGGESADQVVRMSLEGAEVSIKLAGEAAKQVAILLFAILSQEKKTKGKTRLTSMLRSGKELKVFTLPKKDLEVFCKQAKKYGVLYCMLNDKKSNDGIVDLMVRAEDASKINRICERFSLAAVDAASIKAEIERSREEPAPEQEAGEATPTSEAKDDIDQLLNELMPEEVPETSGEEPENPTPSPTPEPEPVPENASRSGSTLPPKPVLLKSLNLLASEPVMKHLFTALRTLPECFPSAYGRPTICATQRKNSVCCTLVQVSA